MSIQKYHIVVVDKSSGEIYLDVVSKDIDSNSSLPFSAYMDRYLNILRLHPFASLLFEPVRPEFIEASINFV